MDDAPTILRQIMDRHGLTQERLSRLIWVHRVTVAKWTSGKRVPWEHSLLFLKLLLAMPEAVALLGEWSEEEEKKKKKKHG